LAASGLRAGYPNTKFHDLRHGAASRMMNAGIDLFTVGGALGRKSVCQPNAIRTWSLKDSPMQWRR
jgi:hypothetical protein